MMAYLLLTPKLIQPKFNLHAHIREMLTGEGSSSIPCRARCQGSGTAKGGCSCGRGKETATQEYSRCYFRKVAGATGGKHKYYKILVTLFSAFSPFTHLYFCHNSSNLRKIEPRRQSVDAKTLKLKHCSLG